MNTFTVSDPYTGAWSCVARLFRELPGCLLLPYRYEGMLLKSKILHDHMTTCVIQKLVLKIVTFCSRTFIELYIKASRHSS